MTAALERELDELVDAALAEDVGDGDRTTAWTVPGGAVVHATVVAKSRLVVSGIGVAARVFRRVDPALRVTAYARDGDVAEPGAELLSIEGAAASVLTAERTALNFLGRLAGIATLTRRFVDAVEGTGARIIDTRKTTPGLRRLEKDAVRAGGGENHRMGLYDMALVKENHIAAAGGIEAALEGVLGGNEEGLPVEIEVRDLTELTRLRGARVDRILLDNMTTSELRTAVEEVRGWGPARPGLEASGNMTLERVAEVAATGVEWISVGALTHSAPAADVSLLLSLSPGASGSGPGSTASATPGSAEEGPRR